MKKVLYIALASLILMTSMNSCEKWLDVNTSPDQPTTVTCDVVLPSLLFYATQNVYDCAEYGIYIAQSLTTTGKASTSSYPYKNGWGGWLTANRHPQWRRCYIDVGVNSTYLIEDAEKKNARNYILIAKTLRLHSLLLTTDIFGDIPVRETFAYAESVEDRMGSPRYDHQSYVYEYIQSELEELIKLYEDPEWINCSTNGVIDEKQDRMFAGDLGKWRAFTKALYARVMLRQIPNQDLSKCQAVINAVDAALNDPSWTEPIYKFDGGTAEQCCMWGPTQPKMNLGWAQARENLLTSAVPSEFMAAILGFYPGETMFAERSFECIDNGVATEEEKKKVPMFSLDPRADRMMEPRADAAKNRSLRSLKSNIGMDVDFGTDYKAEYFPDLYCTTDRTNPYTKDDGYIAFITEEELLFAKAEALYWLGNIAEARSVTLDAVRTSFNRYGVYGTLGIIEEERLAIFEELRIPATGFTIAHLMQQKYVAMYLQPEQWCDVRRYNYSSSMNGIQYDNVYVYDVEKVFNPQKSGVFQANFTQKVVLTRPFNIYEPHWSTDKDLGTNFKLSANAWMNRISADPETEEKYNRPELERLGIYQNPDWMRNRMIWQKPGNTTAITNFGDGEWMYSNPELFKK